MIDTLARRTQTQVELDRLGADCRAWARRCRQRDKDGQYKTQLEAIEGLVSEAVSRLAADLEKVDTTRLAGDVYEDCRRFDIRLVWLRRVWQFFRERFDQRADPQVEEVLKAADEVVWSCHRQVVELARALGVDPAPTPSPLPFIESYYSPAAFPVEIIPQALLEEVDAAFLHEFLNALPVPVVRLQPSCVTSPWWLVYVGHEVGHHIQYGLLPKAELVQSFRISVEEAIRSSGGVQSEAIQWGNWSREIFADFASVFLMGPWALWAMVEFELERPEGMLRSKARYPAAAVRLRLMAQLVELLEMDAASALRGLDPSVMSVSSQEAFRDLQFVEPVVGVVLKDLPDLPTSLRELCAFDHGNFAPDGVVGDWSRALLDSKTDTPVEESLRGARLATSAAVAAWSQLGSGSLDERVTLRDRAIETISRCREPGTRAGADEVDVASLGSQLAGLLSAAPVPGG